MQEGRKVEFTQKWIEGAVKKLFQKEDIYESDMDRIKYLRIGQAYGAFVIEMSTATPADPFWDANEPDNGWDEVVGDVIRLYIDYAKAHPFESIDSDTGKSHLQLTQYHFWSEFEKNRELEEEEDDEDEDGKDWKDIEKEWKDFEKTILCVPYREKFDSDDAFDEWEEQISQDIQKDIGLFTGLEVLRMLGADYQNLTFIRTMPRLRVLEVVESNFVSMEGIDDLVRLKQLCCWLD